MASAEDRDRLDRVLNTVPLGAGDRMMRLRRALTPEIRMAIRTMIEDHEKQINGLKEQLEGYDEMRSRLELTQKCLIVALKKMGGEMMLFAGQLNRIPPKSVVGVEKMEHGEGDAVPLRVYWRAPGGPPASTDMRGTA